jgi:hypothetical protein
MGTLAIRLDQPPRLFSKQDLVAPGTAATKPARPRPARPEPTSPAEILALDRPDIARRFRAGDKKAAKLGRVGPSQRFNEAVSVLVANGLTDAGSIDLAARLFAPGRGQRTIGKTRFGRAMQTLQVLAERVRTHPEMVSPEYQARRLADLAGHLAEIADEASRQRGAHTVQRFLEAMRDALANRRGRTPIDGVVGLLDVMELESMLARTWETVRSLQRRFDVSVAVLTPEGGPPLSLLHGGRSDALTRRLATIAGSVQPPPGRRASAVRKLMGLLRLGGLEVVAHGSPGEPLARSLPGMGLEKYMLGAAHFEDLPTQPPGLAEWLGRMFADFERAHLVGPGFGDELFTGLALAPRDFNQNAQNKGVEEMIRRMAATGLEPEVKVSMKADRLAIPMADGTFEYIDVVRQVEYTITHGDKTGKVRFDVDGPPTPGWRVTHNDFPPGVPGGEVLHGRQ